MSSIVSENQSDKPKIIFYKYNVATNKTTPMSKKAIKKIDSVMQSNPTDEEIITAVKEIANDNEPTERTISSRFSRVKGYLSQNYSVSDKTLRELRPPSDLTDRILEDNARKRNDKKQISFSQQDVDNFIELKDSKSPFDLSIFLQIVSGRRISELFDNDIRISKKDPSTVMMHLNKTGSGKKKFESFSLLPDAELTNKEFKELVLKLRSSVAGMSLNDFNKRVNRSLKKYHTDLTSHNLRSIYANYMYEKYNKDNQILTGFISKVLNHAPGSDAGINYSFLKFTR